MVLQSDEPMSKDKDIGVFVCKKDVTAVMGARRIPPAQLASTLTTEE
jgi:hypothetical protein